MNEQRLYERPSLPEDMEAAAKSGNPVTDWCRTISPQQKWLCTRHINHTGQHVAVAGKGEDAEVCFRWEAP